MIETPNARQAWADYLALGAGRSLEALLNRYQTAKTAGQSVPTVRLMTLADWSRTFGWQARLQEIADQQAREIAEQQAAYRRAILEEGLALDHERVKALKDLAGILLGEAKTYDRRWLPDVKQIGSGLGAERVDIERFNGQIIEQFRGLLDDIAKEKAERAGPKPPGSDEAHPLIVRTITAEIPPGISGSESE